MAVISVVMAVKNGEATVNKSIASILRQSFTNFEFLIADDYSTDNTNTIIRSFNDARIKLVRANRPGLVPSLNHCLQQAQGKYIARMDSDDYAHPKRFQLQVELLEKDKTLGVVSGLIKHQSTQTNQEGYAKHVSWLNTIITPNQHFENRFRDAPLANPSAMFRKNILGKYGLYKEFEGPEDYEFWLRLLHNGVKFGKVNNTVLDWYDYATRLTRNHSNYDEKAFSKLKAKYFSLWWHKEKPLKKCWVWGYGKEVLKKSRWLVEYGVTIAGYIDLTKRPNSNRTVITHLELSKPTDFILVYVSERSGQKNIENWLSKNNYIAGVNYYFMT